MGSAARAGAKTSAFRLEPQEEDFLNDLEFRSARYFWEQAGPTGIVRDRSLADGSTEGAPTPNIGSVAATGFGLTALCLAGERGWLSPEKVRSRVSTTLRFLSRQAPREHGWFYHYMDVDTGERVWNSEISSIDTALLLAGVLTAGEYFSEDPEIASLAAEIYAGVDFRWMLDGDPHLLRHGWTPESGFLPYRWDSYCELMILYILGIGSPSYPLPVDSWYAWKRPELDFHGIRFVTGGPLFVHQYSHAWFDFRLLREKPPNPVDWWENSVRATRAQREFCYKLSAQFASFSADLWGVTASDSAMGYTVWGEPPRSARINGTIAPSAAGGSVMFVPEITVPALWKMQELYGLEIYKRYGFVDAFNPADGWIGPDVVGIDVGIILLSIENLRSGWVWKTFMKTEPARSALRAIGVPQPAPKRRGFLRRLFSGHND